MEQATGGIVTLDVLPIVGEQVRCCGTYVEYDGILIRADQIITVTIGEQETSYKIRADIARLLAERREAFR